MPVWRNALVDEEPEYTLVSWAVFEIRSPDGPFTRHVVGEVGYGAEGKVSSTIRHFDAESALFRTASGRSYLVRGPRGLRRQGQYLECMVAGEPDSHGTSRHHGPN